MERRHRSQSPFCGATEVCFPDVGMLSTVATAARLLDWRTLRFRFARCPICGPTVLVRLQMTPIGVRCVRCGGSGVHLSIAQVVEGLFPDLGASDVYELSSRGPFFEYLKKRCRSLAFSEYFDDVAPGAYYDGVQCQDVQRLTYADESFDLCTSTEVFEHVPDDILGFKEIFRVLRSGGKFVFTVPLRDAFDTVERARLNNGEIEHLLSATYHGDRLRGAHAVLCYRDYGRDIVERLTRCGFSRSVVISPSDQPWWKLGCNVICAEKAARVC